MVFTFLNWESLFALVAEPVTRMNFTVDSPDYLRSLGHGFLGRLATITKEHVVRGPLPPLQASIPARSHSRKHYYGNGGFSQQCGSQSWEEKGRRKQILSFHFVPRLWTEFNLCNPDFMNYYDHYSHFTDGEVNSESKLNNQCKLHPLKSPTQSQLPELTRLKHTPRKSPCI